jgi:hypothetical protein
MNQSKRLGFCIPTYKRPELLLKACRSIIVAARDFAIPLYISDDSCSDINSEVIKVLHDEYPYIKYSINKTNLGIDGNIVHSVNLCECDYAWLLGEDDLVLPGAVEKVLAIIDSKSPPFIFANYSYVNNDYSKIIKKNVTGLQVDSIFESADFFSQYSWATGFIGGCVINKSCWSKVDIGSYMGTYYAHLGGIYEGIPGKYVYAIAEPLVLNRAENKESFTWADQSIQVHFGWDRFLSLMRGIYGNIICEKAITSSQVVFKKEPYMWLISKRADGVYNARDWWNYIYRSNRRKRFVLLAWLISHLPPLLLHIPKNIIRYFKTGHH